jgi:hypothetical protein
MQPANAPRRQEIAQHSDKRPHLSGRPITNLVVSAVKGKMLTYMLYFQVYGSIATNR